MEDGRRVVQIDEPIGVEPIVAADGVKARPFEVFACRTGVEAFEQRPSLLPPLASDPLDQRGVALRQNRTALGTSAEPPADLRGQEADQGGPPQTARAGRHAAAVETLAPRR